MRATAGGDFIKRLQLFGGEGVGDFAGGAVFLAVVVFGGFGNGLAGGGAKDERAHLLQRFAKVGVLGGEGFGALHGACGVVLRDGAQDFREDGNAGSADDAADMVGFEGFAAVGDLVQDGEGVAQTAAAEAGDFVDGVVLEGDVFGLEDGGEALGDDVARDGGEGEAEAAGADGGGQALGVGGGEDEAGVFGGFLEGFEQRVEGGGFGSGAEGVDFVHDEDAESSLRGGVSHFVHEFADLPDLGVAGAGFERGGVQFHDGGEFAVGDVAAVLAFSAGVLGVVVLAVEQHGEDAREGGFADAAGAGEEIGVMSARGAADGVDHIVLSDDVGESLRTPFARQRNGRRGVGGVFAFGSQGERGGFHCGGKFGGGN